jgi:phosphoserine phosphatase
MVAQQNTVAVIFDFDDTLTDESTTKLLQHYGVDAVDFWQKQNKELILEQGWDPIPAYMKLMLDNVGEGMPLGKLTNEDLRRFGGTLKFYPGVATLFKDLRAIAQEHSISHPSVEFYVITSGLEEIVKGSKIAKELNAILGCNFAEENGEIKYIKNVVSFTEKTRYVFEINKGLHDNRKSPYDVNRHMDESDRPVPLKHMIYVGDGLTDVPCFSLIQHFGGQSFGVFDPKKQGSPKKGLETLVAPKRVMTLNSPRYGKSDDLGALLRTAVNQLCVEFDLRTRRALH